MKELFQTDNLVLLRGSSEKAESQYFEIRIKRRRSESECNLDKGFPYEWKKDCLASTNGVFVEKSVK